MDRSLAGEGRRDVIPRRWARYYLENAPSLVWLIFANVAGIFVGFFFYLSVESPALADVDTLLWPLYMDSPVATLLMALALATLLPNLGRRLDSAPSNLVLAYLHTITFVWLVETGMWTALALNLHVGLYFPDLWRYFGVLVTHVLFIPEAYLLPHFGHTTRGALGLALALALFNDVLDYGFGLHPPLRYDPGPVLVAGSVATSVLAVGLAAHAFGRLPAEPAE
ncbi:DUF1405 domain-containing protein [Halosimplex salinum]|uniref:DUF1405 domain-containing protein n=1 Tax=Halosimplex salinum TaxID=1710538 RepID=UPI000F492A17|nr:DUF1405 domain-containing protein [Halosimplex salinum]